MTHEIALHGTALWLGLLAAFSPCPLATNFAATAFLARHVPSRQRAILATLAYTLGRISAYVLIAGLLGLGLSSAPNVSHGLQRWLTPLLGPLLVLVGMMLTGLLSMPLGRSLSSQAAAEGWASRGLLGAWMLGFLFALSFCPVSAALFFGSLIPVSLSNQHILLPVLWFGTGTSAPVAVFALVMIFSTRAASRLLGGINLTQPWILKITGSLLIAIGLYLTAKDTLEVLP